jgi:glycosyltransferase involved in cell wall biosynthesis
MFSVVIPTMWRGHGIDVMLNQLKMLDSPFIGEVIIIDNDPSKIRLIPPSPKVRYLPQKQNIYVNPAWNLGVKTAKFDQICLMSDDIIFDPSVFEQLSITVNEKVGVIGLDDDCDVGPSGNITQGKKIRVISAPGIYPQYERTFGVMMFVHKNNYFQIPEEFKIFLGDAWLFHHNRMALRLNARVQFLDVIMTRGTTSGCSDMYTTVESDFVMRDIVYSQHNKDMDSGDASDEKLMETYVRTGH